MDVVKVEFDLMPINKSVALFKCQKSLSGVIHVSDENETTVILDGGYVLGEYHCQISAIKVISLLAVQIADCEKEGFGNYKDYKCDYTERVFRTIH